KSKLLCFFFSSRRRHTSWPRDWSSDVCSSDLSCCQDDEEDSRACGRCRWAQIALKKAYHEFKAVLSRRETAYNKEIFVAEYGSRSEERRVGKECRCRWWRGH